jgi:hypothetical protein
MLVGEELMDETRRRRPIYRQDRRRGTPGPRAAAVSVPGVLQIKNQQDRLYLPDFVASPVAKFRPSSRNSTISRISC